MATQPLPFPRRPDGATPNQRMALDNLIRRELKVGDPSDPEQVARALLERYQHEPRARGLKQEAAGLPFLQSYGGAPAPVAVATATSIDLQQAVNDVNKDLEQLLRSNLLKDVQPELAGWAQAIRAAMDEGVHAARAGLDTRQRDKAFGIRRQLGDYARMARLVGALTPASNYDYRNLAQSLDEISAVLLVLMGEALSNTGLAGGHFLLQAPYSELQVRRDAAIYALRNLVGAAQEAYAPNEWPRGLDAYRRLYDALEVQGQGDLRALLVETELARIMDELLSRSGQGSADGLRALGSTAQIDLQSFKRLVAIGRRIVVPESPPLTSFLEALALFADAFEPAGGFRLLRVARPSILFYGLYGFGEEEKAERRLAQLVIGRGMLASQLDCLMRCNCDTKTVLAQVVLDKFLYQVDRAIDLYALGDDDLGAPEARAAATSYLADAAKLLSRSTPGTMPDCLIPLELLPALDSISLMLRPIDHGSETLLWEISAEKYQDMVKLNKLVPGTRSGLCDLMLGELCTQFDADLRWQNLVKSMAPSCVPLSTIFDQHGVLTKQSQYAMNLIKFALDSNVESDDERLTVPIDCGTLQPDLPAHYETALSALAFHHGASGEGRYAPSPIANGGVQ